MNIEFVVVDGHNPLPRAWNVALEKEFNYLFITLDDQHTITITTHVNTTQLDPHC